MSTDIELKKVVIQQSLQSVISKFAYTLMDVHTMSLVASELHKLGADVQVGDMRYHYFDGDAIMMKEVLYFPTDGISVVQRRDELLITEKKYLTRC